MQALRTSSLLTRLVLAWFVAVLGVAGASPFVHPGTMEVVCSAAGAVEVVSTGDGPSTAAGRHALDCPLCLPAALPLPVASTGLQAPQPLGQTLQPIVAASIAALVGAPLPARGPPSSA